MASSVHRSLQCLISALTQRGKGGRLFRLTCSVLQWEGGTLQANIAVVCGECWQCLGHTGFVPAHGVCAFPVYTAQAPGCSAGEPSKEGPGLRALPRSKPLRFRFLGTPQKHRLSWACVLCPSQVRAAQATRCSESALSPGGRGVLSPPLSQPPGFLAVQRACHLGCAMCLFWAADLWL